MRTIKVIVENKIARLAEECCIVCGNSDYFIEFEFDEEWSEHSIKTARFAFRDKIIDVVFEGSTVNVPILEKTKIVSVGVFAGDLITTTPVKIDCELSILCGGGMPADPPPEVYAQIVELYTTSYDKLAELVEANKKQLEKPNISIDGEYLTITDKNGVFAEYYALYANDTFVEFLPKGVVDLEDVGLMENSTLRVVAKGDRFIDSELSEPVEYYYIGLSYRVSADGTYYYVAGIGTETDENIIVKPSVMGLPVKLIHSLSVKSSVTIPNSITKITSISGNGIKLYYQGSIVEWCNIDGYYGYTETAVSLKGIAELYVNNELVKNLFIPEEVAQIKTSAFVNIQSIESVDMANTVEKIGVYAFFGCGNIKTLSIGNGVKEIGYSAFEKCTSLESVTIPNSVEDIYGSVFAKCSKLESIVIPNSVKSVGQQAFEYCTNLQNAVIGDGVNNLEHLIFRGCTKLKSVTIGKSVKALNGTFINCTALTDIYYNGTVADWANITKTENWSQNTGEFKIHCTDGDIAKG